MGGMGALCGRYGSFVYVGVGAMGAVCMWVWGYGSCVYGGVGAVGMIYKFRKELQL